MKVCLFTENYYKGGLDTFLINLINFWPDQSDTLTLVCNNTHPGLETIGNNVRRPLSIEKYRRVFTSSFMVDKELRNPLLLTFRYFLLILHRVIYYPILFPWYLISLIFFFRIKDYDRLIVVNGGYPASLLCRAAIIAWWLRGNRTKGVFNFHNSTTTIKWYLRVPEFVIDYLVRISSSYIVSVSLNCLNSLSLRPAFNGYNMFVCIYNGIEDPIGLLNAREKYRDKVERYCLMLATYEIRKGHEFILEAFEILVKENRDKIKLVICGHGSKSEKDRVRKKIEELDLGNYVILRDFTPVTTDLIFYSDLLVIPSQANESFGLTAIEAMSLYTPVIATDVGGLPEVLGGCDSGFICSRTDPKEFANAMNRVLQNKSKAIQLGQNGRLCFERRYSASLMAEQYYKLINFK